MSRYYHVPRTKYRFDPENPTDFAISRSKIELFLECPRCAYVDLRLGVKRVPGYPFSLNNAVDELFKREFDQYRKEGQAHPIMKEHGVDAVPFAHEKMDTWRHPFEGVRHIDPESGLEVYGAPDDIWQNPAGKLAVVDYKATSKEGKLDLSAEWQGAWKRQMEVYQWLLRGQGFDVSDRGYFVYANGDKSKSGLDGALEFNIQLLPYDGDGGWVEEILADLKETMLSATVPDPDPDCDWCTYREVAGDVIHTQQKKDNPNQSLPF